MKTGGNLALAAHAPDQSCNTDCCNLGYIVIAVEYTLLRVKTITLLPVGLGKK